MKAYLLNHFIVVYLFCASYNARLSEKEMTLAQS